MSPMCDTPDHVCLTEVIRSRLRLPDVDQGRGIDFQNRFVGNLSPMIGQWLGYPNRPLIATVSGPRNDGEEITA